jgi:branched-chain amino acid transport system permease protein
MLAQLAVSGLVIGSLYALMALGMTVLYRATTVVNFGHGEFFMLGAFAVYVTKHVLGWPYAAAIAFSFVLLFLIGMLIERGLMRPLQNAPHLSLAMMTVALSFLFKGVTRFFYGRDVSPLPPLIDGEPIDIGLWDFGRPDSGPSDSGVSILGSAVLFPQDVLVVAASLAAVLILFVFFQHTRLGKVIQAASQTPRGAALVGVNVPALHSMMWGVAAAMGALAGLLIAPSTLVYPDMGEHMLIRAFAAMTLGGFGSLIGAVIGGFALGVIENLMGGYVSSSLVDVAAYLVIIVVLLLRPSGLFGEWRPGGV